MPNELGESFALLPSCSEPWIWIAKPAKSGIKKFIGRGSVSTGALSVERPAKYELGRTIVFSSHLSEPMVNKRRFSDPGPGYDCNDVIRTKKPLLGAKIYHFLPFHLAQRISKAWLESEKFIEKNLKLSSTLSYCIRHYAMHTPASKKENNKQDAAQLEPYEARSPSLALAAQISSRGVDVTPTLSDPLFA
jgi:hypothetical protein